MRARISFVALVLSVAMASGCACLQVPRIDPTGERIFAEPPVAAPQLYRAEPGPQRPGDDVAVLLSPPVTVAPVDSEVVLLAGVGGPDGYLRTNRRLEWSIAPGGVGHFVDVGRNGPVDWLVGDFNHPRKVDNTFVVGSTSRSYLQLNRGTPTTSDDVCVQRGQGWVTLTSPVEGTSQVTVFAPEVYGWDRRKQVTTVHWVDAQWAFPPPAINPAGSRHLLTTTVIRHSNKCPYPGWRVRYEILDGPPTGFAPEGGPTAEVETDAAGQASVEMFQKQPLSGTNRIAMQVIRPAGFAGPNSPRLVVGSGSTLKTWTAPSLAIRKLGPAVGGVGTTLTYRIEVSNPGDLPAPNVVVTDELPPSLSYVESRTPGQVTDTRVQWALGTLGPRQVRVLELNCRANQAGSITNCAEATADGGLKARGCATTTVTGAVIDVRVTGPAQAAVGSQVTFSVVVTNHGQAVAKGLLIKDRFPAGLEHAAAPSPIERDLGDLGPNESRPIEVTFRVTQAGRLCHTVEVSDAQGVVARGEGCVTGVESGAAAPTPPPSAPASPTGKPTGPPATGKPPGPPAALPKVAVKKTGPSEAAVGDLARFSIEISNTSTQMLTNLRVVDQSDAELPPSRATEGYRQENGSLVWTIDSLGPGKATRLEVECRCEQASAKACNRATVIATDGSRAEGEACLTIRPAAGTPAKPETAKPETAKPGVPGPTSPGAEPSKGEGGAAVAAKSGLRMAATGLSQPARAGRELTYVVRISNQGLVPQKQLALVATLPQGMMPVLLSPTGTTSGPSNFKIQGQTVRFEPVAEIRPSETLTYRIRALAKVAGKLTFRAELTTADPSLSLTTEATTEVLEPETPAAKGKAT